eukprot:1869298-Rhodomonas_salina.6
MQQYQHRVVSVHRVVPVYRVVSVHRVVPVECSSYRAIQYTAVSAHVASRSSMHSTAMQP